jgi:hypothetical protein
LLTKAGGRRQKAGGCFCNGDLGSPLQKLFALKGEVLDPIFSINFCTGKISDNPPPIIKRISGGFFPTYL